MQEPHYSHLQAELVNDIYKSESQVDLKSRVAQRFEQLKQDGLLDCLDPDEVNLLEDYRQWKASPKVIGGIFHWKVRKADAEQSKV